MLLKVVSFIAKLKNGKGTFKMIVLKTLLKQVRLQGKGTGRRGRPLNEVWSEAEAGSKGTAEKSPLGPQL